MFCRIGGSTHVEPVFWVVLFVLEEGLRVLFPPTQVLWPTNNTSYPIVGCFSYFYGTFERTLFGVKM